MEKFDVIIIGAGPSGVTAAIYAERANLSYLLLEGSSIGGKIINAYEVENYPGFSKIGGAELALTFRKQVKDLNLYFKKEKVVRIDKLDKNFFVTTSKDKYQTRSVVLAIGTKENKLNLPKEDRFMGRGVSFCATCDGAFYKDKDVVVYGGGDSAITEASFLAPIAKTVTIISRHKLRGEDKNIKKLLSHNNVTSIPDATIIELIGDETLKGVRIQETLTKEIKEIPCDGVFVYIGSKPDVKSICYFDILKPNGYIEVDDHFRTSTPNLYAIGDCIDKEVRQIVTATGDGANVIHTIINDLDL